MLQLYGLTVHLLGATMHVLELGDCRMYSAIAGRERSLAAHWSREKLDEANTLKLPYAHKIIVPSSHQLGLI